MRPPLHLRLLALASVAYTDALDVYTICILPNSCIFGAGIDDTKSVSVGNTTDFEAKLLCYLETEIEVRRTLSLFRVASAPRMLLDKETTLVRLD